MSAAISKKNKRQLVNEEDDEISTLPRKRSRRIQEKQARKQESNNEYNDDDDDNDGEDGSSIEKANDSNDNGSEEEDDVEDDVDAVEEEEEADVDDNVDEEEEEEVVSETLSELDIPSTTPEMISRLRRHFSRGLPPTRGLRLVKDIHGDGRSEPNISLFELSQSTINNNNNNNEDEEEEYDDEDNNCSAAYVVFKRSKSKKWRNRLSRELRMHRWLLYKENQLRKVGNDKSAAAAAAKIMPMIHFWKKRQHAGKKRVIIAMPYYACGTMSKAISSFADHLNDVIVTRWMNNGIELLRWLHDECGAIHGDAHMGNFMLVSSSENDVSIDDDLSIATDVLLFDFDECWKRKAFVNESNFAIFARIDTAKFLKDLIGELVRFERPDLSLIARERFDSLFADALNQLDDDDEHDMQPTYVLRHLRHSVVGSFNHNPRQLLMKNKRVLMF